MITIRPISDLRNKFSEVEADVLGADQVFGRIRRELDEGGKL